MEKNPIEVIKEDAGFVSIIRELGCIGDSLSSGEHESKTEDGVVSYHDYYEYSWGQFIARKCGIKVRNFSVGGIACKNFEYYADWIHCFRPENACQAYTIALGVNDVTHLLLKSELYPNGFGKIEDVMKDLDNIDKSTFIASYINLIVRIRKVQGKARIFVITPPREENIEKERAEYYDRIAEFLRELPKYFEFLYVIDLRKYAPVYDREFDKKYRLGGHLNAMGYKLTADMILTYMNSIIEENYEDFKQIAFIGKNVYNAGEKW